MRSVSLPISSAGMNSPRPHPGPARPTEKSADGGQGNRNSDEPGHNPPRKRIASQGFQPSFFLLPAGVRADEKRGYQSSGDKDRPGMKNCQKCKKHAGHQQDGSQMLPRMARPDSLAFNVHVKVGNDDQRHDYQRGYQDSRDEWGKKVQQFLKAKKIPGRFSRIRSQ